MSFQQQLYDQIRKTVAPNKDFLIFKTAKNWDWKPSVGFTDPAEHQLIGTMPSPVGDKDPFYQSSGASIYNAYKGALYSVKLTTTPEHREQIKKVDEDIAEVQAEQEANYRKYQSAWENSGLPDSEKEEWKENTGWEAMMRIKCSVHMQLLPQS